MLYAKAKQTEDMYIIHTYANGKRDKSKPLHMYTIKYPDKICSLSTENKEDILEFIDETFNRFGAFNYEVTHSVFENGVIQRVK